MKEKFTQPVPATTTTLPLLPRYRSHKVVRAARIAHVAEDGALILDCENGTDQFVRVMGPEWIQRNSPKAGGFLVEYEDGYTSYSPGPAFEDGYTRLAEPPDNGDTILSAGTERPLTTHSLDAKADALHLFAIDTPGGFDGEPSGGAPAFYGARPANGAPMLGKDGGACLLIPFQTGPVREVGVNGLTNEALLAIVQDRLERYQDGPLACPQNAAAWSSVRTALAHLHMRTRDRMARGVEGTHEV